MIIPRYANMGRIVGVRSTKQFVGIKVGAFAPDIIILYNENQYQGKKGRNHLTGTCLLFFEKKPNICSIKYAVIIAKCMGTWYYKQV